LIVFVSIALAFYGLNRISQARYRVEPAAPLLRSSLAQLIPAVSVAAQRQRSMLREDNFWEAARALARTGLEKAFGLSADQLRAGPPKIRASGSWREQWAWRRQ